MAAPAKFLFDMDFSAPDKTRERPATASEIATGDCRIEWADGGVVLERAAIEAKIDELVGRYMASRGGTTTLRNEP